MLKSNLKNLFNLRGIDRPIWYLMKCGFEKGTASRIANEKIKCLTFEQIESLCRILNCQPNNLFRWIPDANETDVESNPLYCIKDKEVVFVKSGIMNVAVENIEEYTKALKELEEKFKQKK
jgi:DNA-binding Xre family transcriptional regulator